MEKNVFDSFKQNVFSKFENQVNTLKTDAQLKIQYWIDNGQYYNKFLSKINTKDFILHYDYLNYILHKEVCNIFNNNRSNNYSYAIVDFDSINKNKYNKVLCSETFADYAKLSKNEVQFVNKFGDTVLDITYLNSLKQSIVDLIKLIQKEISSMNKDKYKQMKNYLSEILTNIDKSITNIKEENYDELSVFSSSINASLNKYQNSISNLLKDNTSHGNVDDLSKNIKKYITILNLYNEFIKTMKSYRICFRRSQIADGEMQILNTLVTQIRKITDDILNNNDKIETVTVSLFTYQSMCPSCWTAYHSLCKYLENFYKVIFDNENLKLNINVYAMKIYDTTNHSFHIYNKSNALTNSISNFDLSQNVNLYEYLDSDGMLLLSDINNIGSIFREIKKFYDNFTKSIKKMKSTNKEVNITHFNIIDNNVSKLYNSIMNLCENPRTQYNKQENANEKNIQLIYNNLKFAIEKMDNFVKKYIKSLKDKLNINKSSSNTYNNLSNKSNNKEVYKQEYINFTDQLDTQYKFLLLQYKPLLINYFSNIQNLKAIDELNKLHHNFKQELETVLNSNK